MILPPSSLPLSPSTAALAASADSMLTKPKPRDLPSGVSETTDDVMAPKGANRAST